MRCVLAICAVFRDEAEYLREWLEFHQLMGVERFYLYNNNSSDRYLEALQDHLQRGTVVLHEWPQHPAQLQAYEHCRKTYGKDVDWLAFIDLDEFLFSPEATPLPDVLAGFVDHPAVGVNWVMFGSAGHRQKPAGGVLENYLRRGQLDAQVPYPHLRRADGSYRPENSHIKCIVQPSKVRGFLNAHSMTYADDARAVDENLQAVEGPFTREVSVAKLRINHYWSKSEDECQRKFSKGWADGTGTREWSEFLLHERFLNDVHDDTVLRVVAQLGVLPPRWPLQAFVANAEGVWHSPARESTSHGALHRRASQLFDAMRESADTQLFSASIADHIVDGASALALSPRRANLLHLLEGIGEGRHVLEIGCGAGAMTQAWIERGCRVDAIEFAPHWARVAAARLKPHPQARIFQASLRQLQLSPEYDVVFLGAPKGYAEAWPHGETLSESLRIASAALNPDGILVLAVANGSGDGDGVDDGADAPDRRRIETVLRALGLDAIDVQLVFPDIQLPEVAIAERALREPGALRVDDLVGERPFPRDGARQAMQWQRFHDAGTLAEHAPGLLLIARRAGTASPVPVDRLAQTYVDDRLPALNQVIDYVLADDGVRIVPRPMLAGRTWRSPTFEHVVDSQPLVPGRSLLVRIRQAIHARRSDALIALLQRWLACVYAQADEDDKLDGAWLDAVPARMLLDADEQCVYRGPEWRAGQTIEKQIPIYVGLWQLAQETGMEQLTGFAAPNDRMIWLCKRLWLDAAPEWIGHGRSIGESLAREIHDNDRWNRTDRFVKALPQMPPPPSPVNHYKHWQAEQRLDDIAVAKALQHIESGGRPPRIRVLLIDAPDDAAALQRSEASLRAQQYPHGDVHVVRADGAGESWAGAANRCMADDDAEWVQLMFAGDVLHPSALLLLAERIASMPHLRASYFDEDTHEDGTFDAPIFKPDLNLDLLRSYPYVGRAIAFQRERCLALGGLKEHVDDLAGYDLLFRILESDGLHTIGHIGQTMHRAGLPYGTWLASAAVASHSAAIVAEHLQRLGVAHALEPGVLPGFNRVRYLHARQPLVSIIVPTRDQLPMLNGLIDSLLAKTSYPNYELLIVDNDSREPAACAYLDGIERLDSRQLRVLRYPHPFNYSAINNFAASQARGEYLVLLNNDTAILHDDWIEALLHHAQRPEVGIVGAKLHYPDGRIQHGGVILGLRGPADHPFIGQPMASDGYMHRLQVDQNYTAVTAACLMVRKSVYDEVGGLDERDFKVSYNDVDLCLKVHKAGYLTVWTPYARLMHEGSVSQTKVDKTAQEAKQKRFQGEQAAMYRKWMPLLARDPAYSTQLSIDGAGFELDQLGNQAWQPFARPLLPRLFCVAADAHGCGHYRIRQPLACMQRDGLVEGMVAGVHLTPVAMERFQPAALILQRQVTDTQIRILEGYRDFSQAFKVFELDDYLPNVPVKSAFHSVMPKDVVKSLRRAIGTTDRFVVSTAALAEQFKGFHSDIRVVENRLPPVWWRGLKNQRRVGARPRVGWGGGSSHRGDLELIADVVRDLAGEVEWVFFGMCPDKLRPYVHEFHLGVPIEEYPAKLASLHLDLALAPLEDNVFNACKSNLRLLEYGACGFPVICSDIACYDNALPATRVKNRYKDWMAGIRMHLDDMDATARAGDDLRDAVYRDWMLEGEHLTHWRSAWLPGE